MFTVPVVCVFGSAAFGPPTLTSHFGGGPCGLMAATSAIVLPLSTRTIARWWSVVPSFMRWNVVQPA